MFHKLLTFVLSSHWISYGNFSSFHSKNLSNILKNNGVLILHRHKKEKENFSHEIKIIEEKIYGISKIIFLTF